QWPNCCLAGLFQLDTWLESGWPLPLSRKCGMRNSERGIGKEKWQMTNGGWQMTNGGWRMGDNRCHDETGHPRFPGARKWVAPSAFRAPTSKSRMRSKIMKKIKIRIGIRITRKIRPQSAALPCALDPLPNLNLNLHPDLPPDPDRNPPPSSSYPLYKIHGDGPTRRENS